ncbi:MAG: methylated-DNA--[protein]-cysteine S-methyltransferase [Desulforegulaceae bacterium]|nr:methylated-DNA--[protein]-cysteine S-methyltransferase [Desulforegulaceae bacterium]
MLNQIESKLINTKINSIKPKSLEIISADKVLKNFLNLKSAQPKALVEKIEKNPVEIFFYSFNSSFGKIRIFADKSKVLAIDFDKTKNNNSYIFENFPDSKLLESKIYCEKFFEKIFYSQKKVSIKTGIKGSDFFIKILTALSQTNSGELISYKKLGKKAGFSNAHRAVGTAMKKNPIPFLIPCHRVIKSNLTLGFYSGGIERKIIYILRENNHLIPKNLSTD